MKMGAMKSKCVENQLVKSFSFIIIIISAPKLYSKLLNYSQLLSSKEIRSQCGPKNIHKALWVPGTYLLRLTHAHTPTPTQSPLGVTSFLTIVHALKCNQCY